MNKHKKNITKIILITFIFSVFFVFSTSKSFAAIKIPTDIFDFSAPADSVVTDEGETGHIDLSLENKAKVCRDVTCTNPAPGVIDFKISGDSPITIDSKNGITGKAWGDDLGWVTFNPPYGGIFFADTTTGLLKGTAWSETSGAINFSVTGQKVYIDPGTGELNGWAWASGPYGGWIKFDCKESSCVHTTWRNKNGKQIAKEETKTDSQPEIPKIIDESVFANFKNSIIKEISKINGSAFTTSATNLKNFSDKTTELNTKLFSIIGETLFNTYSYIGEKTSDTYTSISSFFNKYFVENKTQSALAKPISRTRGRALSKNTRQVAKNVANEFYVSFANLFKMTNQTYTSLSTTLANEKDYLVGQVISALK